MFEALRKHVSLILAVLAVAVLAVTQVAAQTGGSEPREVATDFSPAIVSNSDKVDGKHAVGFTSSKSKRARKLVATNRWGNLPSNIVKPDWSSIRGVPFGFADGIDDVGYSTALLPCGGTIAGGAARWVRFFNLPRNMQHQFMVIPTSGTAYLAIETTETRRQSDGKLNTDILVRNQESGLPAVDCKVRLISFYYWIAPAKAKAQLSAIEVDNSKKKRR